MAHKVKVAVYDCPPDWFRVSLIYIPIPARPVATIEVDQELLANYQNALFELKSYYEQIIKEANYDDGKQQRNK